MRHPRSARHLLPLTLLVPLLAPAALGAQPCGAGSGLGATLLAPYFEVDVGDPHGRTTLLSVADSGGETTVVRVVLWTNAGLPTLGFDVLLPAHGEVSLNLRDVFAGKLPVTGSGIVGSPPGCGPVLTTPSLTPDDLALLLRRHTGQPDEPGGLCHGLPTEPGLAVGYVTVDAMTGCAPLDFVPGSDGYFDFASQENVLWGDFILVDAAGDLAQSFRAVPIVGDPALELPAATFYGHRGTAGSDLRWPLAAHRRIRFLAGDGLGSDLLVWRAAAISEPFECGLPPGMLLGLLWQARDLSGTLAGLDGALLGPLGAQGPDDELLVSDRATFRVGVGSDDFPVPIPFGTLDLVTYHHCIPCGRPYQGNAQAWVGALASAEGRFSVGLDALEIPDRCP